MKEQPNQGRARGHGKGTETWCSILSPSSGKTWMVAGVTDCIFQRWPLSLWLWHSSHWEVGSILLGWLWGQTYDKGWSNSVTSWGQIVNDTLLPGSLGALAAGTQVLCLAEAQTAPQRISVPAHSLSRPQLKATSTASHVSKYNFSSPAIELSPLKSQILWNRGELSPQAPSSYQTSRIH